MLRLMKSAGITLVRSEFSLLFALRAALRLTKLLNFTVPATTPIRYPSLPGLSVVFESPFVSTMTGLPLLPGKQGTSTSTTGDWPLV